MNLSQQNANKKQSETNKIIVKNKKIKRRDWKQILN